jgi:hypothetical protein
VDGLLKNGFSDDLVKFEAVLGTSFKIPFTAICAYKANDISNYMNNEQFSSLHSSHGLKRISNHNVLENPPRQGHIALMYEDDCQRNAMVAKFINAGLRKNELCIYASIRVRAPGHLEEFSKLVENYEANVNNGNLAIVDMAPFYIAAMNDNLEPFENASAEIKKSVASGKYNNVRFVGDCADFLFKNKHFDECIRVEEWGQGKPFEGCYLCPYPKDMINKYPYDLHKFRVHATHDIVADEKGNMIAAYSSFENRKTKWKSEH